MSETSRPAELSFCSLTERLARISPQREPLEQLNAVLDWQIFQPVLDRVCPAVASQGPGGRPAYPRLFLCQVLVLQRLHHLADEAAHHQILDRLSCQRFPGLNLAGQGLLPKAGVSVDASFVEVPRQRDTRAEKALLKTGQTPADWSAPKRAHKEVDARWTQQDAPTFHGHKDHLKVNLPTKLSRRRW